MKFAQLAIGSILFIEAFLLMYSPQEKYNIHAFMELIKGYYHDCEWMEKLTFECVESVRLFMVAFIVTGAFSLTFGSSVLVGLLAQVMWTVTQSETYYSSGLKELSSTLTQVVFVLILLGETRNDWIRTAKLRKQLKQQKAQTTESSSEQPQVTSSKDLKSEEQSVAPESKSSKSLGYSEDSSAASKSKKKKNK